LHGIINRAFLRLILIVTNGLRLNACNRDVSPTITLPMLTFTARAIFPRWRISNNWWDKDPWLTAFGALLCGLVNGYEVVYLRPDSPMAIVDGAFAIGGFIAFVALLLSALSDDIYKSKD
jgi:hypothetical protein